MGIGLYMEAKTLKAMNAAGEKIGWLKAGAEQVGYRVYYTAHISPYSSDQQTHDLPGNAPLQYFTWDGS